MNQTVYRAADTRDLILFAAHCLVRLLGHVDHRICLALAGGSTPRVLYERLASADVADRLPWRHMHFFWGDERHVPPDHPESNYRLAYEALLSKVPVPASQIHRIHSELPRAVEAAERYEQELRTVFPVQSAPPRFDLILLGMGEDGHTASLFPGSEVIHETAKLVAAPWVEKLQAYRITLTPVVLNAARQVWFLVCGEAKARALQAVLEGPYDPDTYPAQIVRPVDGQLVWFVDAAAAAWLSRTECVSVCSAESVL
ncbi:MAG: 6-phosphogluconolactonase [Nitrospirae bacterium]|nr:MAG: 6-phosphogluconolactonase [Nitrospirota bacterium]